MPLQMRWRFVILHLVSSQLAQVVQDWFLSQSIDVCLIVIITKYNLKSVIDLRMLMNDFQ